MPIQDDLAKIFLKISIEIEEVKRYEKIFDSEPLDIIYNAFAEALMSAGSTNLKPIKKSVGHFLRHWKIEKVSDKEFEAMIKILMLHPSGQNLRFIISQI